MVCCQKAVNDMTAPTHASFGILIVACADAGLYASIAAAIGALIPDIDHPQSSIGRLLWFVSFPVNNRFGHRGVVHSLSLWSIPLIIGLVSGSTVLQWVSIGCISHCVLDTMNKSGVRLFEPFSSTIVVCPANSNYRISTASVNEIVVFMVITGLVFLMGYGNSIGGIRKLVNRMIHSSQITQEEYVRAGYELCYAKGDFRWREGLIEKDVKWLVVGTEDSGNILVYWNGSRLVKTRHGEFIKSELIQTKQQWTTQKINGFVKPADRMFYFDGVKWHVAYPDELAYGWIKPFPTVTSAQ